MAVIIDDTPDRIKQYWVEQNSSYIFALLDPDYIRERDIALEKRDPLDTQLWRQKLSQLDPSHPKALIPEWVRFSKRKAQEFKCYILGWHESDWMRNRASGSIQQVGMLTVDHTLAAAHGGLTTDTNTKMVAEIANNKKGSKQKSYEDMREHLHTIYELYVPSAEELIAFDIMRAKKITKVKL
jgi:hypothetical protein